jgi:hypothetical protein
MSTNKVYLCPQYTLSLAFLNSLGLFFVGCLFTIFHTRSFTSFSIIIIVIIKYSTSTCLYWGLQAFLWAYNFWIFIFIISFSIFKTLLIYVCKLGYYSSIVSSSIMVSLKLIAHVSFSIISMFSFWLDYSIFHKTSPMKNGETKTNVCSTKAHSFSFFTSNLN